MFGLAEFLIKSMSIINSSMELLFDRFSNTPFVNKNVDVMLIRHRNSHVPYTGSETVDNGLDSWENFSGYPTIIIDVVFLFYII